MFRQRKKLTAVLALIVFVCGFLPVNTVLAIAPEKVPAPFLVGPDESAAIGAVKPAITGLSASGTAVYIYIDGTYNGRTETLVHESGTADFSYRPYLNLSVGEHTVWAIAKDRSGNKSPVSNALRFRIEKPFPAPTLLAPVINKNTSFDRPYITGLAKNDSLIKVFIDERFFGEFKVKNDDSGTANFAYLPFVALTEGPHMVYTVATNEKGKDSRWSNILYFNVRGPLKPAISPIAAAEENISASGRKDAITENKKPDVPVVNNDTEPKIIVFKDSATTTAEMSEKPAVPAVEPAADTIATTAATLSGGIDEIEQMVNRDREKINDSRSTGLINERTEEQGQLKFNSLIFIIFLLAVIGWIFWVNRELIREKRQLAANDDGQERKNGE